jgi:hypothetical protein
MPNFDIWKIHVLLTYTISELSFNFFGGDFWWILKFSIFVHLCMYVCMYVGLWCLAPLSAIFQLTCCYMYFLGIQCKRQNIPDHAFYSYSVLNRSLSYICNISFLEVHLERVATRSDSSTGILAFMGDDLFVNPLCVGFCILWINGCILSLIKHWSL